MSEKHSHKKYASAGNPMINAAIKSLFRFATMEQALDCLNQIKRDFVTSRHIAAERDAAILWIRGYEVTAEEETQGYTGNFAFITFKPHADKFILSAMKLASELKFHPQRRRPKKSHPDWGHPILRDIKKRRIYDSAEEAIGELARLHEEFPTVSIPGESNLLLILYEKVENSKSPVQKYKFSAKALPEGGFIIEYKRNIKPVKTREESSAEKNAGYFTAMVKLKKKRKKKPSTQAN